MVVWNNGQRWRITRSATLSQNGWLYHERFLNWKILLTLTMILSKSPSLHWLTPWASWLNKACSKSTKTLRSCAGLFHNLSTERKSPKIWVLDQLPVSLAKSLLMINCTLGWDRRLQLANCKAWHTWSKLSNFNSISIFLSNSSCKAFWSSCRWGEVSNWFNREPKESISHGDSWLTLPLSSCRSVRITRLSPSTSQRTSVLRQLITSVNFKIVGADFLSLWQRRTNPSFFWWSSKSCWELYFILN